MKKTSLITVLILISLAGFAQRRIFGNSISFLNPVQDFGRFYSSGHGIKANFEFGTAGPLSVTGELGWNKWSASPFDGSNVSDVEAFDVMAGVRLNLIGPLYAEGRTGYYFGDFDKFTFIPAAGLRIRRFDLNVGYQLLNNIRFIDTRIGMFWGGRR